MRSNPNCLMRLQAAGISRDHACTLRRISMTLHRWYELECGDGNDYASWTIARGHKANGAFEYDDAGKPFVEYHSHTGNKARYTATPDRERGALKRLGKIMADYPAHSFYVQTDPRGCSLYISQAGEALTDSNYNRGIAVHR